MNKKVKPIENWEEQEKDDNSIKRELNVKCYDLKFIKKRNDKRDACPSKERKEKDGFPLPVFTSTGFMGMTIREIRIALVKQGFTDQV